MLTALGLVLMLLLLGWSLGLGWLMSRLLSFTLFEGTLLSLLITLATITVLGRIILSDPISEPPWLDEVWDDEDEDEDYTIPPSRFWKQDNERTAEKFTHYVLANEIYAQASNTPQARGLMGEQQLQELSIRLGELALQVLKKKRKNARDLSITIGQLQQQMEQMNLQPYDPEILALAAKVVNELLAEDDDDEGLLTDIIRQKRWLHQM
ncbi:MAG: hypothetical protein Fur0021_21970 [Candidatus Promineifilaceae bacterium]